MGLTSQFPDASGEADDADADGANNLAEMLAGTDPINPDLALKFEITPRPNDLADSDKTDVENSRFPLYFQSIPGRTYAIQGIDAIDGKWQTDATVTATTTQKRVVLEKPVIQRFYRVMVQP